VNYDSKQITNYKNLLKAFSSLTKLFSDNNQPYLEYRAMENIYCKSFNAINLAREDGAFDAKIGTTGIGLKTFGIKEKSVEKIAEFNKYSLELKSIQKKDELAHKLAILRNERILTAKKLHGLLDCKYHCIGRRKNELIVFETDYPIININNLSKINKSDKSLSFFDDTHEYRFNFSKSVLMKKFSLEHSRIISNINIKIFNDPYDAILKLLDSLELNLQSIDSAESIQDFVILPLYSTRNKNKKIVQEKSGLNQWNANGRARDSGEIYIPIPATIHKIKKDFFPARDTIFNLKTPKGDIFSSKVCQENSKALMTNPNKALSDWLLREVLSLEEHELLTYEKLKKTGYDAVRVTKIDNNNYEITLSALDSYEKFIKNFDDET
jgi:hypothetical protein